VTNARLGDGVKLLACTARILGLGRHGKTLTLVVYGPVGETGSVRFSAKDLTVAFPESGPQEQSFVTAAGQTVRVLAMNPALADHTWIVDGCVICGPAMVDDVRTVDGRTSMTIERPYGQPSCGKVIVYADQVQHLAVASDATVDSAPAPQLRDWRMRPAPEAAAAYDDAGWKVSGEPLPMGADGDTSALAWYRAVVNVKAAGVATLRFSHAADNIVVMVNGRRQDDAAPLEAGRNVIAVLASHHGRDKAFNYMGSLETLDRKGLFGPVQLTIGHETVAVAPWKMRGGVGVLDGSWQPVAATDGAPAFYRASFTATKVPGRILRATSRGLSRGTMWLNGHNLGRYPEKIKAPGLYLPECWLKDGENTLVVFDEEGASITPVKLQVETAASREVIPVAQPCDPATPLVVASMEPKPVDLVAANKGNLAFRKPATASSSERENKPEMANDGDPDSRWCASSGATPQWWRVDLGTPHNLAGCEITWESEGRRYQYVVEGSADGRAWSTLADRRQAQERTQVQNVPFTASGVRYVRILVTGLPKQPLTWASICEVKVWGAKAKE
jgi:beta-galactosidase